MDGAGSGAGVILAGTAGAVATGRAGGTSISTALLCVQPIE